VRKKVSGVKANMIFFVKLKITMAFYYMHGAFAEHKRVFNEAIFIHSGAVLHFIVVQMGGIWRFGSDFNANYSRSI
jgi:hypothetical protein